MKAGHLSEYFTGVAAKRLSAVEANVVRSNQHEFNGADALKKIFGTAAEHQEYQARFIYLNDHDPEPVVADTRLTWYDARANHPTRTEHRLYFPDNEVSPLAAEGDLLVIGLRPNGSVLVVIAEAGSTIANQVQWLFGLNDLAHPGFSIREELETDQDRVEFAARFILEQIGVKVETVEETLLDGLLHAFGNTFPTTRVFSQYSRNSLPDVRAEDDADAALMAWMEREEILFRTLERHLLAERLRVGFEGDVDGFISFSLSVQNRRKSRVGLALENHLEAVFQAKKIHYTRTGTTENKSKPDFLFPSEKYYQDGHFDSGFLTMLGVKSTCKDRWRQVLAEADRIKSKHLLTLEAAISSAQTNEMRAQALQLVIPHRLHETFGKDQRQWLWDVTSFADHVLKKQAANGVTLPPP